MLIDQLRIVGSAQTATVMGAEFIRVATRAHIGRPPPPRKEGTGQLVYPFSMAHAEVAVRYMRTATRVVWDCYASSAKRLDGLYHELVDSVASDTRPLFRDGDTISVEAKRLVDFPAGERQIVGTVKNALIDGAAQRGLRLELDVVRPRTHWVVRQHDDGRLLVARDLGAGSLTQRGWRQEAGEAPIREHLAAALLMLARFNPRNDILVDPMCGSGTIPLEAYAMARGQGRAGTLGLAGLPTEFFDAKPLFADAAPLLIGCDADLEMLRVSRDNAIRAGVGNSVVWQRSDVAALTPELVTQIAEERRHPARTGLFLCNPPYGERLAPPDLRLVYGAMVDSFAAFSGWRAGVIVDNPEFEWVAVRVLGQPRIKQPLANGNLRAYFYLYEIG